MENAKVIIGSEKNNNLEEVNLMDIGGFNFDQVEEFRFSNLPKGIYEFKILNNELTAAQTKKGMKAVFMIETEVANCLKLEDSTLNTGDQLGRKYTERVFVTDPIMAMGIMKAFLVDIGLTPSGEIQQALNESIGTHFIGLMGEQVDKDNTDKKYARLDLSSLQPASGSETVSDALQEAPVKETAFSGFGK